MKSDMEIREEWYEFANSAFIAWRGDTRKTLSEFAEWVGISQPLMSRQTRKGGSIPQDQKTIAAWVNKYGVIVYDVLGLPVPEDPLDSFPEPMRSAFKEYISEIATKGFVPNSPEAKKTFDAILEKNGINYVFEVKDHPKK